MAGRVHCNLHGRASLWLIYRLTYMWAGLPRYRRGAPEQGRRSVVDPESAMAGSRPLVQPHEDLLRHRRVAGPARTAVFVARRGEAGVKVS